MKFLEKCDERRKLKSKKYENAESNCVYRQANNIMKRKTRNEREKWINQQCKDIELSYNSNNTEKAYQIVRNLAAEWKPKSCIIEDKNKRLSTKIEGTTERWRQYCEDLYNHTASIKEEALKNIEDTICCQEETELDITREEVEYAISKLKRNKSLGTDNINAQLLIASEKEMANMLLVICNKILRTGEWPSKWTEFLLILLPKRRNIKKCEITE